MTFAPSLPSRFAIPCPIPEPAPVTIATFPANRCMDDSRMPKTLNPKSVGCTGRPERLQAEGFTRVFGAGMEDTRGVCRAHRSTIQFRWGLHFKRHWPDRMV